MKILITGIAGCGKTTIISHLKQKGHQAIDLDTADVCAWVNRETGETSSYQEGAGKDWIEQHRWQVIEDKLIALLKTLNENENIFVGGKVSRQQVGKMKEMFDVIYLIKPNDNVIHERLENRTSNVNNFAKTKEERESITQNRQKFEQACIEAGAIVLDNHGDVEEVLKKIVRG